MIEHSLIGQRSARGQIANRGVGDLPWENELKWSDTRRAMRLAILCIGEDRE